MYQNKFVAAIKVNGQVLRETNNGSVAIPFGAEYSIYLKNLNSVRVMARVSVDGVDAAEGRRLVISPNSGVDLERFIRHGNLGEGNRFKFIERTEEIEAHRGARADDGIVRVEYFTERIAPRITYTPSFFIEGYHPRYGGSVRRISSVRGSSKASASNGVTATCSNFCDAGITVPGSVSHQRFHDAGWFDTHETSEVIVLRLLGRIGQREVETPITVKTTLTCETCGKSASSSSSFCATCGTALGALVNAK